MNDNQIDTSAVTDPNLPIQTTQVTANDDDTAEHDDSSDGSDCQVIDETKRPDERPLTPDAKQMGGSLGAENAAAAELIISSTESNNGSTSTSASDTETEVPLTADQINASRSKTLPTILETHPTVPALPYQTENDWTASLLLIEQAREFLPLLMTAVTQICADLLDIPYQRQPEPALVWQPHEQNAILEGGRQNEQSPTNERNKDDIEAALANLERNPFWVETGLDLKHLGPGPSQQSDAALGEREPTQTLTNQDQGETIADTTPPLFGKSPCLSMLLRLSHRSDGQVDSLFGRCRQVNPGQDTHVSERRNFYNFVVIPGHYDRRERREPLVARLSGIPRPALILCSVPALSLWEQICMCPRNKVHRAGNTPPWLTTCFQQNDLNRDVRACDTDRHCNSVTILHNLRKARFERELNEPHIADKVILMTYRTYRSHAEQLQLAINQPWSVVLFDALSDCTSVNRQSKLMQQVRSFAVSEAKSWLTFDMARRAWMWTYEKERWLKSIDMLLPRSEEEYSPDVIATGRYDLREAVVTVKEITPKGPSRRLAYRTQAVKSFEKLLSFTGSSVVYFGLAPCANQDVFEGSVKLAKADRDVTRIWQRIAQRAITADHPPWLELVNKWLWSGCPWIDILQQVGATHSATKLYERCSICFEGDLVEEDNPCDTVVPCCAQIFHFECLNGWFESHRNICTICHGEVPKDSLRRQRPSVTAYELLRAIERWTATTTTGPGIVGSHRTPLVALICDMQGAKYFTTKSHRLRCLTLRKARKHVELVRGAEIVVLIHPAMSYCDENVEEYKNWVQVAVKPDQVVFNLAVSNS